jgi:phosphoserine phosphatase RsbU/P
VEDGVWRARYSHGVAANALSEGYRHHSAVAGLDPIATPEPGGEVAQWLEAKIGIAESLVVQLAVRGRQVGLLLFGRTAALGGFDDLVCDFAKRFADAVALAVANVDDFLAEHRIAETLQEALLTTPQSVRGVDFSHLYRSSTVRTRVGGDFYDIFELAHGRVGIVIGDVSGKGLEAAVLTSVIKDTIHAFAHDVASPAQVVARANIALGRAAKLPEFASVFFGILETRTASLTYCCAGHPPAAVLSAAGEVIMLESTSPVIGALEDLEYQERTTQLAPGDRVFLYTDGVTEARAADGVFFGEQGLDAALHSYVERDVCDLPTLVFDDVMSFTEGRLTDDIALFAFRLA